MLAGQPATLAVLDADGRLLPGSLVEFSGGERVTTDQTGRARFKASRDPGVLMAHIAGSRVSASGTVLASRELPDGIIIEHFPPVVSLHSWFVLRGSGFQGEADANRVTVGDQPALVLAASPVALIVQPSPRSPRGLTQLLVQVGGRDHGPVPITVVMLEIGSGKTRLGPGEQAELVVRVRGTAQRVELEIRNATPETVTLAGGDTQRVSTRGGPDNTATVKMVGRAGGSFFISVRLMPQPAGLPDAETLRRRLLAARQMAPANWTPRVDRLLRWLEADPRDLLRIRDELERMLAEQPPGEFGRALEAAWRLLVR